VPESRTAAAPWSRRVSRVRSLARRFECPVGRISRLIDADGGLARLRPDIPLLDVSPFGSLPLIVTAANDDDRATPGPGTAVRRRRVPMSGDGGAGDEPSRGLTAGSEDSERSSGPGNDEGSPAGGSAPAAGRIEGARPGERGHEAGRGRRRQPRAPLRPVEAPIASETRSMRAADGASRSFATGGPPEGAVFPLRPVRRDPGVGSGRVGVPTPAAPRPRGADAVYPAAGGGTDLEVLSRSRTGTEVTSSALGSPRGDLPGGATSPFGPDPSAPRSPLAANRPANHGGASAERPRMRAVRLIDEVSSELLARGRGFPAALQAPPSPGSKAPGPGSQRRPVLGSEEVTGSVTTGATRTPADIGIGGGIPSAAVAPTAVAPVPDASALDAATLTDLVNDVLIEQARRQGVDLV